MAESSETPVETTSEAAEQTAPPAPEAAQPQPQQPAPQQQRLEVDENVVQSCYANFCRVNGTPEELIIDFGLNSQPFGASDKPLKVSQRLVVNYYTAKRLLSALQLAVHRHESAFGVLETNVQKRVLPNANRQG